MEHDGNGDTNSNGSTRKNPERIDKETGRLRNRRTSEDPSRLLHYEDRPEFREESWRLEETETPMKDHHLTLLRKIFKKYDDYRKKCHTKRIKMSYLQVSVYGQRVMHVWTEVRWITPHIKLEKIIRKNRKSDDFTHYYHTFVPYVNVIIVKWI